MFIEKSNDNKSEDNFIPYLFFRKDKSPNFQIYFHGNSEHIFEIEYYRLDFLYYLNINNIMLE
jgi:hypothetical protein